MKINGRKFNGARHKELAIVIDECMSESDHTAGTPHSKTKSISKNHSNNTNHKKKKIKVIIIFYK